MSSYFQVSVPDPESGFFFKVQEKILRVAFQGSYGITTEGKEFFGATMDFDLVNKPYPPTLLI